MLMTRQLVLGFSLVVAGCASDAGTGSEEGVVDSFKLTTHTPSELDATLVSGGASLRLTVAEPTPSVVDVTFDFGDPVISFRLDYNRGMGDFTPSGGALDEAQLRLVDLMVGQLEAVIAGAQEDRTLVEEATMRQASFMQVVPTGQPLSAFTYYASQGWTHISCTCGSQNIGGYTRTAGRGCGCTGGSGNGCKGRCGQGCGITSTPSCVGSTAYTQDCAKHDWGLGSWGSASDDYSFAGNNCSCSGVGTCY